MTKLSWRQVLVIVGGVCLLDPCARVANAVDTDDGTGGERPNIVWLIGEQLSPDFGRDNLDVGIEDWILTRAKRMTIQKD